jgi:hypothetical protein
VGSWRDQLCLIIWTGETTEATIQVAEAHVADLARQPGHLLLMNVIEEGAPMPSSRARKALAAVLGRFADAIAASAVVCEGVGFRAAAVRGVVTGLTLIARQPYPHKAFPTVETASRWLAARETGLSSDELTTAIDQLRQATPDKVSLGA